MNIGLIDIEPKIFNTAYMQISQYHKERGDTVEWWNPKTPLFFDRVYCSSLFVYTDKSKVPKLATCGGTGYCPTRDLPPQIAQSHYDYSIYPKCEKSFIWFSRGCVRDCRFCIVRLKEGFIHHVEPKNLNSKGKVIVVMDNNFFAPPLKWRNGINWLLDKGFPVDFQGVDVRFLSPEKCKALNSLRHHKQIKMAWDNPRVKLQERFKRIIKIIPAHKIMCYVLIGYWSTKKEDFYRVETLRNLDIDPFVMPYNKHDPYQKDFARWVNHKAIFKSVKWSDYK